jgi:hypothetical protein
MPEKIIEHAGGISAGRDGTGQSKSDFKGIPLRRRHDRLPFHGPMLAA